MQNHKIRAWLKPSCGWSGGVRAVFKKYNLAFEDKDVINRPENFQEMVELTGQMKQPCVEIDGRILADVSGEEVEAWMIQNGIVKPSDAVPEVPIDQPCAHEIPGAPSPVAMRR